MLDAEFAGNAEILAVSVDARDMQQAMIDRINDGPDGSVPNFRMLHDQDNRVINRYGVLNPEGYRGRTVPHPSTFVIDREGVVRWKVIETDYRMRPTGEQIMAAVRFARGEGEDPGMAESSNVLRRDGG